MFTQIKFLKMDIVRNLSLRVECNVHLEQNCRESTCYLQEFIVHLKVKMPLSTKKEEYVLHVCIMDICEASSEVAKIVQWLDKKREEPVECKNSEESKEKNLHAHQIRWSLH